LQASFCSEYILESAKQHSEKQNLLSCQHESIRKHKVSLNQYDDKQNNDVTPQCSKRNVIYLVCVLECGLIYEDFENVFLLYLVNIWQIYWFEDIVKLDVFYLKLNVPEDWNMCLFSGGTYSVSPIGKTSPYLRLHLKTVTESSLGGRWTVSKAW
jgi:hypothetical protein